MMFISVYPSRYFTLLAVHRETVSLEGTFCDTVQVPSGAGDMKLN